MFSETTLAAILSLALLGLFIWYWSTELDRTKRLLGTLLTAIVVGCSLFAIYPNAWKGDFRTSNIAKGIDLGGGTSFVVTVDPGLDEHGQPAKLSSTALDNVRSTLEGRLSNTLQGRAKPITPIGDSSLEIQIPGLDEKDYANVVSELTRPAVLNFHLVDRAATMQINADQPVPIGIQRKEIIPIGSNPESFTEDEIQGGAGRVIGITTVPAVDGTHVKRAAAVYDGRWFISVTLDGEGGRQMDQTTGSHIGEQLSIVLDGTVISAPTIKSKFSDQFQITGDFTQQEAEDLSRALENPLRYAVKLDSISTVSPSLGEIAVRQGIWAGIGSLICVLIFLIAFYRFAGLIALFGIFINMLILFGAVALANQDLTLPGIAGVILTLGMSVDSNVLIYERLKEELQAGKSLKSALSAAYDKAFSAIFDSNLTTLLTAAVLFWLGSDALKGFAATLVAGIIGTMFAALVVTRVGFRWMIDGGKLKTLSVGKPWKKLGFDFMGKTKLSIAIALALMVVAIAALVWRGDRNLSIEFTGGERLTYPIPAGVKVDEAAVREAVSELHTHAAPVVELQTTTTGDGQLIVKLRNEESIAGETPLIEQAKARLAPLPGVAESIAAHGPPTAESIGATFGESMLTSSLWALGLGLLAIAIYLMLRFRPAFAMGATLALAHDLLITIGLMALFGFELNTIMVGAYLTIAGYSINDTIVVFDRIREILREDQSRRPNLKALMNEAINSTLSRTLLTSTTTLSALIILAFFGGPDLRAFSLAIFIGVVAGTFSSIFVASPVVYLFSRNKTDHLRDHDPLTVEKAPQLKA